MRKTLSLMLCAVSVLSLSVQVATAATSSGAKCPAKSVGKTQVGKAAGKPTVFKCTKVGKQYIWKVTSSAKQATGSGTPMPTANEPSPVAPAATLDEVSAAALQSVKQTGIFGTAAKPLMKLTFSAQQGGFPGETATLIGLPYLERFWGAQALQGYPPSFEVLFSANRDWLVGQMKSRGVPDAEAFVPAQPAWATYFYPWGIAMFGESRAETVLHETTHMMMSRIKGDLGGAPWFEEGTATFIATAILTGSGADPNSYGNYLTEAHNPQQRTLHSFTTYPRDWTSWQEVYWTGPAAVGALVAIKGADVVRQLTNAMTGIQDAPDGNGRWNAATQAVLGITPSQLDAVLQPYLDSLRTAAPMTLAALRTSYASAGGK